jgi:hypothetical protein
LERENLERELLGKKIALVFDDIPRTGNMFVLIVRGVDTDASMACLEQ